MINELITDKYNGIDLDDFIEDLISLRANVHRCSKTPDKANWRPKLKFYIDNEAIEYKKLEIEPDSTLNCHCWVGIDINFVKNEDD